MQLDFFFGSLLIVGIAGALLPTMGKPFKGRFLIHWLLSALFALPFLLTLFNSSGPVSVVEFQGFFFATALFANSFSYDERNSPVFKARKRNVSASVS